MKRSIIAALSLISMSSAFAEPMMCTMDYTPVCGKVQVQCIKAPCYPIYQTYGNKCGLNADKNATYIKDGECGSLEGAQVILSENMIRSLKAQYQSFKKKIATYKPTEQIKMLEALMARIDVRKAQLDITSAITVERRDTFSAALEMLKKMTQDDINILKSALVG